MRRPASGKRQQRRSSSEGESWRYPARWDHGVGTGSPQCQPVAPDGQQQQHPQKCNWVPCVQYSPREQSCGLELHPVVTLTPAVTATRSMVYAGALERQKLRVLVHSRRPWMIGGQCSMSSDSDMQAQVFVCRHSLQSSHPWQRPRPCHDLQSPEWDRLRWHDYWKEALSRISARAGFNARTDPSYTSVGVAVVDRRGA
jgi:hypothetical protein